MKLLKAPILTCALSWNSLELKMCGYNGSVPSVESLHQEVSVLVPDPTVSCLDDPSHLPDQLEDTPILSEDSLEPFDSLAPGELEGWIFYFQVEGSQFYHLKEKVKQRPCQRIWGIETSR